MKKGELLVVKEEITKLRDNIRDIVKTGGNDWETIHVYIDKAVLDYIDDAELTKLCDENCRWYA